MQREKARRRIQLQQKSKAPRRSIFEEIEETDSNWCMNFRYGDIATEMMAQLKQEQARLKFQEGAES